MIQSDKLLDNLPSGIIDGIIGGDTHMSMHHWEKNIPMMSTPTHSRYINIMYVPFKKDDNGKYILDNDEIKIEGPYPPVKKYLKIIKIVKLLQQKKLNKLGIN